MAFDFFYWLGLGTTVFALALLLVGGLGDYLKNIFNLQQKHILVMAIGCLLSVVPYVSVQAVHYYKCRTMMMQRQGAQRRQAIR